MDSGCVAPPGVLPPVVGRARRHVGEAQVCPGQEISCFLEPKPRVEGSAGGLSLYLRGRSRGHQTVGKIMENQPRHMEPLRAVSCVPAMKPRRGVPFLSPRRRAAGGPWRTLWHTRDPGS